MGAYAEISHLSLALSPNALVDYVDVLGLILEPIHRQSFRALRLGPVPRERAVRGLFE